MKNPLNKRIFRELKADFGKYIALFLFLVIMIGGVSGFLVADNSLKKTYDESFEKYNVEDGHFTLGAKASKSLIRDIEKKHVKVYKSFYKTARSKSNHKIRIFVTRDQVNRQDVLKGRLPGNKDEIAIDRLFAINNKINIGDKVKIAKTKFKVSGYVALSDYSAMFENNADIMFDNTQFGVGIVKKAAFKKIDEVTHYQYAWTNHDRNLGEKARSRKSKSITKVIMASRTNVLEDMVQRLDNQSITFTGDDMGSDKGMFLLLLYIIIVIIAFVFGVTTRSTLEAEAGAIGTLRASGYSRLSLISHYMILPFVVTFIAAIVGNILGYWKFKNMMAALYYNSYSLTTYKTLWNEEAFILTTVIPLIIIVIVVLSVMIWTFRLSPMKFLRRDFKMWKAKRAIKLGNLPFLSRFRIRIILQNKSTYLIMVIGIVMASLLLLFGLTLKPLISHYSEAVDKSLFAKYQYVLKVPVPIKTKGNPDLRKAEKYSIESLQINEKDDISAYGIKEKSKYLTSIKLPQNRNQVVATSNYMEKYDLKIGDTVRIKKKYSDKIYKFKIAGVYQYTGSFGIFMKAGYFEKTFNKKKGYYNGYFSDYKLKELKREYIATTITKEDLKKVSRQLADSMSAAFNTIKVFAVVLYMLVIYLLAKIIVEKNSNAISMIKILGYTSNEAGKLYNRATGIVVVLSLIGGIFVIEPVLEKLYKFMLRSKMRGWLDYYIPSWVLPSVVIIGIASYFIIQSILLLKIRKISMSEALKTME